MRPLFDGPFHRRRRLIAEAQMDGAVVVAERARFAAFSAGVNASAHALESLVLFTGLSAERTQNAVSAQTALV